MVYDFVFFNFISYFTTHSIVDFACFSKKSIPSLDLSPRNFNASLSSENTILFLELLFVITISYFLFFSISHFCALVSFSPVEIAWRTFCFCVHHSRLSTLLSYFNPFLWFICVYFSGFGKKASATSLCTLKFFQTPCFLNPHVK